MFYIYFPENLRSVEVEARFKYVGMGEVEGW
jgi:hypothetical protein